MTLKRRQQLSGTLTGMALTTLCVMYFFALDTRQKPELWTLDWRVKEYNRLMPTTPIVHVDIDDNSLDRVGRWPWRRRQTAELLAALQELKPACVMVDLLLSEPERPYDDDPRLDEAQPLGGGVDVVGRISEENRVYGDLELAEAIRSGGNVVMATQFEVRDPREPEPATDRLKRWWSAKKVASIDEALRFLSLPDTREERAKIGRELLRLRMRDELLQRFTLSDRELAERVQCTPVEAAAVVAGVKTAVAVELVGRHFADGATPDTVLESILGADKDRQTADRADVLSAIRTQQGLAALRRSTAPLDASMRGRLHRAFDPVPLLNKLGRAAKDIAAVNFRADADGTVRRVPILMNYEGRALAHLGLAAARQIMGLDIGRATLSEGGMLTIPRPEGGPVRMPLDEGGNLIIPWTATGKAWRAGRDFPHISAAKVWVLADARRQIRSNEMAINYALAEVIAASKGQYQVVTASGPAESAQVVAADNPYRERVNEQLALARRARFARLMENRPAAEVAELERQSEAMLKQIRAEQELAISAVEVTCQDIDRLTAEELADPATAAEAKRFRDAQRIIQEDVARLRTANAALERDIAALRAELGPLIKEKYVFLGFAATAQGDIVSTPIDSQTNGVMCHAHVLNGILQGQFITPPSRTLGVWISLLGGAIVSWITSARGPRIALTLTLGLIAAYTLVNAYVFFMVMHWWVLLVAPVATVFVTWAFVTLFRQLTAERDRRLFARELGQYTSPLIAARIAESPEAALAFKTVQTRDVTCFFSDLRGFTTMTEEQDPEVTQHVLNTYLHRMSQVIWARRGLINKFMGDGIMAFFNPSVDPLPDHVRAACDTALEAMEELENLKVDRKSDPASPIFDALYMRIGLASGPCKNGDMGSVLKTDYTVIGDVVNLAARLEPANKVFGTQILVSGPTREAVRDLYEFRYLAELQVKGKGRTVPVYEIAGRKGSLTTEQRQYIERFEAGVELYKQRKWDECIVHFTRILSKRFDDAGASRYIDACQEFKAFPPEEDWRGALELKEK